MLAGNATASERISRIALDEIPIRPPCIDDAPEADSFAESVRSATALHDMNDSIRERNGKPQKYDNRAWPRHENVEKMLKGVSLSEAQMAACNKPFSPARQISPRKRSLQASARIGQITPS